MFNVLKRLALPATATSATTLARDAAPLSFRQTRAKGNGKCKSAAGVKTTPSARSPARGDAEERHGHPAPRTSDGRSSRRSSSFCFLRLKLQMVLAVPIHLICAVYSLT